MTRLTRTAEPHKKASIYGRHERLRHKTQQSNCPPQSDEFASRKKFQSIQDFRDQYLEMKKVCDVLELYFSRCESDTRAMLKKKKKCQILPMPSSTRQWIRLRKNYKQLFLCLIQTDKNMEIYLIKWKMMCYKRKIIFPRL